MGESSLAPRPVSVQLDLTRSRASVSGAASGIGRACAERLAPSGATVTVLDLNGHTAKEVAGEIGGEALPADLSGQ
jgi:3-hydroxybutyrate dehydrogenase